MAIELLGPAERERLHAAGRVAAATLAHVASQLRPGITAADIDRWVREDTAARGARPSQLGYQGFPAAVCVSPNGVVCHGIPTADVRLEAGDIVNVDVTSEYEGFHGDTSRTFVVGDPEALAAPRALVTRVARRCLEAGIAAVRPGGRLGDVGAAVEAEARRHGCGVVEGYGGHGIGRQMHLPPHVMHTGRAGTGVRLRPGMAFTIEPMITIGWPVLDVLEDGWTVVTADGSPSAQFEHTVLVTETGVEVTTMRQPPMDAS